MHALIVNSEKILSWHFELRRVLNRMASWFEVLLTLTHF